MITRHFLTVGGRKVHYRQAIPNGLNAQGIVLAIHPVPGSSASLQTIMERLADHCIVIAPDLPGYGDSAGLGQDRTAVADYLATLRGLLDELSIDNVSLYGKEVGSIIALDFAIQFPERVRRLVLDGLPIVAEADRKEMLDEGTPALEPVWSGAHLTEAWMVIRDSFTFQPWYKRLAVNRIIQDFPPAAEVEVKFLDLLRSGPDYWHAVHAAYRYDLTDALRRLAVPAMVAPASADSLSSGLLENTPAVTTIREQDRNTKLQHIVPFLTESFSGEERTAYLGQPTIARIPGTISLSFTMTSIGQILTRRGGTETGRPLVLLHSSPGTSATLEPWMKLLGTDRPVIAFDTPGNGDSAAVPGETTIRNIAKVLCEALDSLNVDTFDLYGSHTGALIAMEIAIARPLSVQHAILDGITMFSPDEVAESLTHHAPPMPFGLDGGHVNWAWNYIRDRALWWHWYNRTAEGASAPRVRQAFPTPEVLHTRVVDFLKGGRTYHLVYGAALSYPTRERLPLITVPTFICASPTDPLGEGLEEASQILPSAVVRILPGVATPEGRGASAELFRAFLAKQTTAASTPGAEN